MRKYVLLSLLAVFAFMTTKAQDDLYFTPKKKVESKIEKLNIDNGKTDDIIDFEIGDGMYPDSLYDFAEDSLAYVSDFELEDDDSFSFTRRMSRFDDFYGWYDPYFHGYRPWWYTSYYYGWYDPWTYRWYDPWYYTYGYYGHYGWGWPYYGGWYGWYYPYIIGYYEPYPMSYHHTGTANHWGSGNRRGFGNNTASTAARGRTGVFSGQRRGSFANNSSM